MHMLYVILYVVCLYIVCVLVVIPYVVYVCCVYSMRRPKVKKQTSSQASENKKNRMQPLLLTYGVAMRACVSAIYSQKFALPYQWLANR